MKRRIRLIKLIFCYIWEDILYTLSFLKKFVGNQDVIFTQLRQNAHILDKGLHINPFEKGHGKKVYQQCLSLKSKITDENIKLDLAFLWIESVIKKYEKAQLTGLTDVDYIPRPEFTDNDKSHFYKILKSRTSCRNFTNEEISDEILDEIIDIAADAPSGCCRQTERYYIVSENEKIRALVKNIAGATGFSGNIPYLVCITADTRSYGIKDRMLPYIDVSLSIQNFLLACTINNIYGTPLNFQHATKKETVNVKNILNIPEYEKIILFIAIGKVNILPLKPKRIDIKQIRKR
ncbi:MAG: nitroreductase family protein [Prevotella sp.]|jgi:nitroreductase|nr:nitroreductase family protein [Prevotella sp.]